MEMQVKRVKGVEGLMAAYEHAVHTVTLQGPTVFGQDGVLTDLQETKDALVRASDLLLSILIVGVGDADFKQMKILDPDTGPPLESSTGRIATRDVHFVPMHDVHRK
ncbi:putative copine, protein BONZAI [Helianthus anomalus]